MEDGLLGVRIKRGENRFLWRPQCEVLTRSLEAEEMFHSWCFVISSQLVALSAPKPAKERWGTWSKDCEVCHTPHSLTTSATLALPRTKEGRRYHPYSISGSHPDFYLCLCAIRILKFYPTNSTVYSKKAKLLDPILKSNLSSCR